MNTTVAVLRQNYTDPSVMPHSRDMVIIRLYSYILFYEINRHSLSDVDMNEAISNMHGVYKPEPGSLSSSVRRLADYNSIVYRCAYLHKYAPFHTAMVCDTMRCILQHNENVFRVFQNRFKKGKELKICSLGGGPGSDTVGVLFAMFERFGPFPCSAKVIDIKSDWKDTFASVINLLSYGMCGPVGECFTQWFFNWDYLTADLLEEVHDDVKSAIGSAELVMMVKFVSAAACESTEWMLRKIFTMLSLGAVVLFIDNASGGFRELVSKAATDCKMTSVYGPIHYQNYTNEAFNITHWNHTSCHSTTVAVHMMQKLHPTPSSIDIALKTVDSEPKPNDKVSNTCSNDILIRNELPTSSSNDTAIQKDIATPSSNDNPVRNKLPTSNGIGICTQKELPTPSSNGTPIRNIIPTSSSKGNTILNKLPSPSSNLNQSRKEHPTIKNHDTTIRRELPTPSNRNNAIQSELPITSSQSNPIQSELVSICHDTLGNELPSVSKHDNPTNTPMENSNTNQNKSNRPVCESIESECVPSTQTSGMCVTDAPIVKETQNNVSYVNLSSKTDNGQPSLCKKMACTITDSKSKKRKGGIQSDVSEHTINEDCLYIPPTSKNRMCARENSKSRDGYNHDSGEDSSSSVPVLILAFLILITYFIKKLFI